MAFLLPRKRLIVCVRVCRKPAQPPSPLADVEIRVVLNKAKTQQRNILLHMWVNAKGGTVLIASLLWLASVPADLPYLPAGALG